MLIVSVMRTHWSRTMNLNWGGMSGGDREKMVEQAMLHVACACKLCQIQRGNNSFFVRENRTSATSWEDDCVVKLHSRTGAWKHSVDQCMYGLVTTHGAGVELPARKPTTFLTNSAAMKLVLNQKCDGSHEHAPLIGYARETKELRTKLAHV